MSKAINKIPDFVLIVIISVVLGWFIIVPFVNFVSDRVDVEYTPEGSSIELQTLPEVNYLMPCDDTDCGFETAEREV